MLGLDLGTFTNLHVAISLVAILAGFIVLAAMVRNDRAPAWTALFLATTALTSITGFMFPFSAFLPSHAFGAVSLVLLALAIAGLYAFGLKGPWRATYVVTALVALYLNAFIMIVQAFQKVGALRALAPTQSEPPFAIAQAVALVGFLAAGFYAFRRFRPAR